MNLNDIFSEWTCEEDDCTHKGKILRMSFMDIIYVGNPICPDCDTDMVLANNEVKYLPLPKTKQE